MRKEGGWYKLMSRASPGDLEAPVSISGLKLRKTVPNIFSQTAIRSHLGLDQLSAGPAWPTSFPSF